MTEARNEADSIGENQDSDLSRRDVIKLGASAAIGVTLGGVLNATAQVPQDNTRIFFTEEEFAMVDLLTESIIPADDHSPGARAAQVASYIAFRLGESTEEEPRTFWREGLKLIEQLSQAMHGRTFLASSEEQRVALLTRISQNEMKPMKPEELFFKELKSRTAHAYYTSKIGIHTEMEYKGNVSLKEFVGFDAN